jgi:tetratricopeptide (TPR) repeat protein
MVSWAADRPRLAQNLASPRARSLVSISKHAGIMKASQSALHYFFIAILITVAVGLTTINQLAQRQSQFPTPKSFVNDFANVLDTATRERLETVLQNFKAKSKIDFYLATVETTGDEDIFKFSSRMAHEWNVGPSSSRKNLLLVISVASKNSITLFSRMVKSDLPDGILGDITQRLKAAIGTEQFNVALDDGVLHFVSEVGRKVGFSTEDFDKRIGLATGVESPSATSTATVVSATETTQTRPRFVNAPAPSETPAVVKTTAETPAVVKTAAKSNSARPPQKNPRTKLAQQGPATRSVPPASVSNPRKTATPPPPVDDEAESEEVELTFTLPLDKRPAKLKEFLATHPNSKSRVRATELLISTYAALGDQKLKNGDLTGVDQLLMAISEADATVSDQLFAGVISQIPMNLYVRNEQAAAFKAAQEIETKYSNNPQRVLAVASFYLTVERGDEAARLADQVLKTTPDLPEAHRVRARGLHLSLRLEEASAEYQRALELDPKSRGARGSLADLNRGLGKPEEALALYNEQLKSDPKDKPAATGAVLSLLELGRKDEANNLLESSLAEDPRNLQLLTGAAYWYAAHDNYEKGFELAKKAVDIEPRYTWAQIAIARSLVGLKRPLDAERALRYARLFGKFPTLTYELASVLASMGLYDEAVEVLRESFVVNEGKIQTRLAGRFPAENESFLDLLAPERRASLYQNTAAGSPERAKTLKDLLVFSNIIAAAANNQKIDEAIAVASAREFAAGTDNMRAFRQIYAASRLLRNSLALQTAYELAEEAKKNADAALETPAVTIAVQADEFRDLRAAAIAAGNVPNVADAPRSVLGDILRGRSDDIMGWALFNQEKHEPALEHLKSAAAVLPNGTPAWRGATWHLGAALEQTGNDAAALDNYILSYKAGPPDTVRRGTIEQVYKRVNGSLQGLDEKLGGATVAESTASPQPLPSTTPETATTPVTESSSPSADPVKTPTPERSASETPKTETVTKTTDTTTVPAAPNSTPSPEPTTSSSPAPSESASQPPLSEEDSLRAAANRVRSIIKISGRVLDGEKVGIGNVVVVLISPSGSVIAATTDSNGNYSFSVPLTQKTYRLIPSKDGLTFTPIDRTFAGLYDDQREIDFVGRPARP